MAVFFIRFTVLALGIVSVIGSMQFRALPDVRMIQGVPLQSNLRLTESRCCLICAKDENCTSVNYNDVTSVCEINSIKMMSQEFRLQQATGWKVFEKLPCGLGHMTGAHCHHIQNLFQTDNVLTYQEALDFCHALGLNLATLETDQEITDLLSDAAMAEMYINAYIWLGVKEENNCLCFRREYEDSIFRSCDLNAAVVCESRNIE
ncbi:uncharacterized protein LOC123542448 [Mercenaria mercenaria]|uniref:uncharacterized protein LOC123542448 n=1 Tax=Mercenaria mercenaria TaxID=6596 RepID=UPI00234EBD19|nr:uncharacterized protein LOC123542448 [Mercenaria mercenaria]